MLSINTNLSSIITQNSMRQSTNKLNEAIERMTTGYKINHAKDNAANYSISTNMTTKIGAYMVAEDNVAMGMDLVTTASDTVSLMQNKAERLRTLCLQARNGTYGAQSLAAINAEANAIISEINRIYSTAQYNGVSLFTGGTDSAETAVVEAMIEEPAPVAMFAMSRFAAPRAAAQESKFISDPITYQDQAEVEALDSIDSFVEGANGTYKIMSADDLAKFADIVNANDTTGATFVLGADIDLTDWQNTNGNWKPINDFNGTFNGNGHVISNLKVVDWGFSEDTGFFGNIRNNSSILNLGLENVDIYSGMNAGGLVGRGGGLIDNCYVTGKVTSGAHDAGGLANAFSGNINNCYSTAEVNGDQAGGLVCVVYDGVTITNSYATGNVEGYYSGGLVGYISCEGEDVSITISDCYATGNVIGDHAGGFIGQIYNTGSSMVTCNIEDCSSQGTVVGTDSTKTGSFIGSIYDENDTLSSINISNCKTVSNGLDAIGGYYGYDDSYNEIDLDMSNMLDGITDMNSPTPDPDPPAGGGTDPTPTPDAGGGSSPENVYGVDAFSLQIGINADSSCKIRFDTNFSYDLSIVGVDISSDEALDAIDNFINLLSEKSTMLGTVQNRLESALESIEVNINNLTSSRSTLRDADMAELSSQYIQQQILQEASATLMATANQSPAIALQLI